MFKFSSQTKRWYDTQVKNVHVARLSKTLNQVERFKSNTQSSEAFIK